MFMGVWATYPGMGQRKDGARLSDTYSFHYHLHYTPTSPLKLHTSDWKNLFFSDTHIYLTNNLSWLIGNAAIKLKNWNTKQEYRPK